MSLLAIGLVVIFSALAMPSSTLSPAARVGEPHLALEITDPPAEALLQEDTQEVAAGETLGGPK